MPGDGRDVVTGRPIPTENYADQPYVVRTDDGGWDCDAGLLKARRLHHVVFIADGGPKIVTCVVDGVLCDGGEQRQYGWGRFGEYDTKRKQTLSVPGDVTGGPVLRVASPVRLLRVYNRYVPTSEAVGNCRAGAEAGA